MSKKKYNESCSFIDGECDESLGLRCQENDGIKNCQYDILIKLEDNFLCSSNVI